MKEKGIIGQLDISTRKNKRFVITKPDGTKIHFGVWPFRGFGTYIDHHNEKLRDAWRARHKHILKDGKPAYLNRNSPEYYSYSILW